MSASLLRLVLAGAVVLLGLALPGQALPTAVAATSAAEGQDPLQMSLTRMSPSVVPRNGTITLSGEVTNVSEDEWREIRIYPRISYAAITTARELRAAAVSDPFLAFGDRITDEGTFAELDTLAPGATASWSLQVSGELLRQRMSPEDGIHQIGVQALGSNHLGRSNTAVGRARTFIPKMGADHARVPATLVVPLRGSVHVDEAGRVDNEATWAADLAAGGRLANLAALMQSGATPVTWLVDPTVLDAVRRLSRGNPGRSLSGDTGRNPEDVDHARHPAAAPAANWLRTFTAVGADRPRLALPYGDLDVAAAGKHAPELVQRARAVSATVMEGFGLDATSAVAPPSGFLPEEALPLLEPEEALLLGGDAVDLPSVDGFTPSRAQVDGRSVVIHEDAIATRVEGDIRTGLTMRQRVLAETAVRSLAGNTDGVVFVLPNDFDPGPDPEEFLDGLRRPHVSWSELDTVDTAAAPAEPQAELSYPRSEARDEIPTDLLDRAQGVVRLGSMLAAVLAENDTIDADLTRLGLAAASYNRRNAVATARKQLGSALEWGNRQLGRITMGVPSFVILSADNGAFSVKLRNRLDETVKVTIVASDSGGDLQIQAPTLITLGPDSTRTVTLTASADAIGVHPVSLQVADTEGRPFGEPQELNVRSNSVGMVIWVIMGIGVGILFLAIAIRWIRRWRSG